MAKGFGERVRWTEKAFSLTALLQKFEDQFPVIAITSCGFHGANEAEVISAGEILRIHSTTSQWRVFAIDVRGRIFSLPLTVPEKFETIRQSGKKSKAKGLDEIVSEYELPVEVTFAKDSDYFEVGETKYNNAKLGSLTLYKFYEERFLRLNTIARGVLDKRVLLLPLYVQVAVKVAVGFSDGSDDEWDSLMTMYDKAVTPAKISAASGLDEILVYDSSEGSIINPQAVRSPHDRPRYLLADNSLLSDMFDSKVRRDILSGKLSAIRLSDIQELDKNYIITDSMGMQYVDSHRRIPNEKRHSAFELNGFVEDEFFDKEAANKKVFEKNILVERKSEPPGHHFEKKSRVRNDDSLQVRKEEENGLNVQAEDPNDRVMSLERPIPAKRRFAPTGRVSPMVRDTSSKSETTDVSSSVPDYREAGHSPKFAEFVSAISDYSTWPISATEEDTNAEVTSSHTTVPPGSYGAHIEHRNTDELQNGFNPSTGSSVSSAGQGPAKSKKSALLKADRRKSNRTKRHVSYSDTDTVYPFDSTDDMADDSEVDGPFHRLNASQIFADNMRNRTTISQIRNPLTAHRRQKGNLVVNVHPGLGRRNTTDLFPTMTRKQFYGSDGSIYSRYNNASFKHSDIEVIPETPEEYATLAGAAGNRPVQYLEMSNLRNFDFDSQRRNASSVISVGNGINRPPTRQQYLTDWNGSRSSSNNSTLRHKGHNGTMNRGKWTQDDTALKDHFTWKHEGRTLNVNGLGQNGFLPQPEYRQRIGNYADKAENQQNFSSKVIRLNENNGNKWAEISDIDRRGFEANHLVYSGATMRRPKDTSYFPSPVANNHRNLQYVPSSAGIASSVTVNGMSPSTVRTSLNPTYAVSREAGSTRTLPWNAKYNHNASKRTVITSSDSPVLERNRAGKKIIPI